MLGRRKVGGGLTEASCSENAISFVVVGVGINVNTDLEDFPTSIRNLATSVRLSTGKAISRVGLGMNASAKGPSQRSWSPGANMK
jgi:BirA family biotin operon repressor/biotin-[acetyl-CoA-carboxylase] ligase